MAEPVYEQVAEAVRARLAEIVADGGATYHYTPTRVVRCLDVLPTWLDATIEDAHFIFVTPETDELSEGMTSRLEGRATFEVWIARKDSRLTMNPLLEEENENPLAVTVISRCVEDVRKSLFSEPTLAGLVWNVADDSITVDYAKYFPGWLMATLTFTVKYDFLMEAAA